MSAWLRNYYNGAALRGGFAFPAGYSEANPGSSNLKTVGENVWKAISGKLSSSKLASMALVEQKLGNTDNFFTLLGYLACMDSTGLQIARYKATVNKMDAKIKAGKATQADVNRRDTALVIIDNLRTSLNALDAVIPADNAIVKSALSKMKKMLHPPTRITGVQRAYLDSTVDPYMPNPALRFIRAPRSANQIGTMMGRLKGSKDKIINGMWNYKLLRDQIRAKRATYRSAPWTAQIPQGILKPAGYMSGLVSMLNSAQAVPKRRPIMKLKNDTYVVGDIVPNSPAGAKVYDAFPIPSTPPSDAAAAAAAAAAYDAATANDDADEEFNALDK